MFAAHLIEEHISGGTQKEMRHHYYYYYYLDYVNDVIKWMPTVSIGHLSIDSEKEEWQEEETIEGKSDRDDILLFRQCCQLLLSNTLENRNKNLNVPVSLFIFIRLCQKRKTTKRRETREYIKTTQLACLMARKALPAIQCRISCVWHEFRDTNKQTSSAFIWNHHLNQHVICPSFFLSCRFLLSVFFI